MKTAAFLLIAQNVKKHQQLTLFMRLGWRSLMKSILAHHLFLHSSTW